MRTPFKAAAFLIAAFSVPQLANAGIIWDLTGTGRAFAESKLRGQGTEESQLTSSDSSASNSDNNKGSNGDEQNNNGDNGNHYAYGQNNNDNNNNGNHYAYGHGGDDYLTDPVVPVETVTEPVQVPEPMSLVLFATGLLAVAAVARRKAGV